MRVLTFTADGFKDFTGWGETDRKVQKRIVALLYDTLRDPFSGIGKPEPLKHNLRGHWSRRITEEDRLVYRV
ncbi:MAG: Txe/YoeB family addiction module toxin, partial [Verrucomicrobia bacterium]|nr:Txe/YoeB family addiction module toxin [Verrucomicrobiota bacterium]